MTAGAAALAAIAALFAIFDSDSAAAVGEFLWPVGALLLTAVACLGAGFVLGGHHKGGGGDGPPPAARSQLRDIPLKDVSEPPESASTREKREAAYDAVLLTSEAYINANREYASYDDAEATSYIPELQEAAARAQVADQQFVRARQLVELYGVSPVLEATRAIEAAVNAGNLDAAVEVRTERLVPEVRKDQNHPRTASF